MSAQFNIKAADPAAVKALQDRLGLPRFVAATLVGRGLADPAEAERFLTPSLDRDWLDPYIIPGLSEVVDALEAAVKRGDHILVFGDFDLDGISATATLTRGLRALGAAKVTPFIPRRFDEGYAITDAAIDRLMQLKPDFLVTVDCGIACKREVARLVSLGVETVVTDHHEPADLVPEGVPVADPKCGSDCPSAILAGVGVALKTVQALGGRLGHPHLWRQFTDFATLGTIADLMPMRAENRALVSDGLRRINEAPRPCIAALLETSGAAGKPVTATNISFSLVPRLNAAGRMDEVMLAVDLLLSDDFSTASSLAQRLEQVNDRRRSIEAELSEIAKAQAAEHYHGQRALIVGGEGWHEGVKGIVASRLVSTYGVPTILFTIEGDEARGSGRSVGQVNLFKAVESCSDILVRFGGHEAAVGLTIKTENLPEFERRLCAYMDALPEGAFHPLIRIDSCVDLGELTLPAVEKLELLAPFGQENPVPVYLAPNVTLQHRRAVGAEKNHFSCALSNGRVTVAGIMFHCSDIETLMRTEGLMNAAFEVQIDEWRGKRSVKAMLKSFAPMRTSAGLEACLDKDSRSFVADLYATSDAELCANAPQAPDEIDAYEAKLEKNRAYWEGRAKADPDGLEREVARAIIGDGKLHEAQVAILQNLRAGVSTLGIMVTGRGKSLTFQVHAASCALASHEVSLFVYPLRALIADQAFHLREALDAFGIDVRVLTGESTPEERARIYEGLSAGSVDIVLTTPEFLAWHADELAASGRIGFVVVDEAHHVGTARAGQREAYANIGRSIARLGVRGGGGEAHEAPASAAAPFASAPAAAPSHSRTPTVLALTATADDAVTAAIKRELPIEACVFDTTDRPNLRLSDRRNLGSRNSHLANIASAGEKMVVYVNSREQSVAVARELRKLAPPVAPLVGFYNAGLSRDERKRIEDMFRSGALLVLVATSAFGEGVDIPDIRHVVLFNMPYNEIEFNQMAGRAGRDGKPAFVHLLYNRADGNVNDRILRDMTPSHDCLAQVYRTLREMQRGAGDGSFTVSDSELSEAASTDIFPISEASAACGIAVFRELGLIRTHTAFGPNGKVRSVHVVEGAPRVELTDSVRYREGLGEREIFHEFREWAMKTDAKTLIKGVSQPILPHEAKEAPASIRAVPASPAQASPQAASPQPVPAPAGSSPAAPASVHPASEKGVPHGQH